MESWLIAVDCVRRHAGCRSYIPGSSFNHENEGKTDNLGCMLYSVYAAPRCMLDSVYAVLGVCCTQCQLMIMPWRDREE